VLFFDVRADIRVVWSLVSRESLSSFHPTQSTQRSQRNERNKRNATDVLTVTTAAFVAYFSGVARQIENAIMVIILILPNYFLNKRLASNFD